MQLFYNFLTLISIFATISSFGELLFSITPEQRSNIRNLENAAKKLSNAKNAVVFNEEYICDTSAM